MLSVALGLCSTRSLASDLNHSFGWLGPYSRVQSSAASYGGINGDADMACVLENQSCQVCAFGTNPERAQLALFTVIQTWVIDYNEKYAISSPTNPNVAPEYQSRYSAQACAIITPVDMN